MKHLMVGRGTREFNTAQAMYEKYRHEFAYDWDYAGFPGESRYSLDRPEFMAAGSTAGVDNYGPEPVAIYIG